ncbi:MAG: AAA family ATPase [Aphanocapsa sp. GSE-SYN-MK-11-07L]|jgi:AAA+ superfamily predicted ATPase|nr:AAA family ATPase [Aphanocapsa sp. GSE-SYN-MK-11-07L]
MSGNLDPIQALRAALNFSPDNVPLRQHLADTLLSQGEPAAAEQEYAQALALDPNNPQLKFGLGRCFYQQGKDAQALVVIEDLLKQEQTAATLTLHARLLLRSGNVEKAVQQFRLALSQDASLQESDLVEQLGINAAASSDVIEGRVRSNWAGSPGPQEIERPAIGFTDVGGMEAVKEEIRLKIIYPLTHAEIYKAYGKAIGGGILMYGPPGCGKTHLARATAGEIQAGFIAVGLNEILDMWIGNSEKNLHGVFDQARRHAPCVLFFDEVDALAASRADLRQSAGRQVINQFLAELDGVQSSNEGVLILAATNAPWHLDSAFRRPGRFDRILFVPPPDALGRATILRLLCKGKPSADIDFELVSKKTDQFSGADLKALVDVAIEKKLQTAIKTGIPEPLTTKDLAKAAEAVKSSTREWFSTARNYAVHANQDGTYDEILKYLKL